MKRALFAMALAFFASSFALAASPPPKLPDTPLPSEVETTHHQVPVRARAEPDAELARQVIARQPGDRLELG